MNRTAIITKSIFLTELAIALLPNLEACVTGIEYDITDEELVPVHRFLGSRFKRLGSISKQPGSLPNIRALGFAKEDDLGGGSVWQHPGLRCC